MSLRPYILHPYVLRILSAPYVCALCPAPFVCALKSGFIKTHINLFHSILSRTLGVMFKVEQLFRQKLSTSFAHYVLFRLF